MLRLIGYWKERLQDGYPLPQELRTEYRPGDGEALATYLEAGAVFKEYRGLSWCRHGCSAPNGSREFTDGKWVWPEGLAHYVRRHPIVLPREFVDDALVANRSTGASGTPAARHLSADDSYWIDWARSYRVSTVESLLREARVSASRTCEAMLTAAAEEQTASAGLGTGPCVTASCGRHALLGKAFCGRCLAERDRARFERDAEVTEIRRVMSLLSEGLPSPALNPTGLRPAG
jgi:hypothetical protein